MKPGTDALIRSLTRAAAAAGAGGGVLLLVLELREPAVRPLMLAIAVGLCAAGPLFFILAGAPLVVLGAAAALVLAGVLVVLGALGHGSGAGFDLGLGICLAAVAVWTLWGHFQSERERKQLERRRSGGPPQP